MLRAYSIYLFVADVFEPGAVTPREMNLLPREIECCELLEVALNVDDIRSRVAGEVQLQQRCTALHLRHSCEGGFMMRLV